MSTGTRPGMRPDDIGALRQAEDPRVSPDGTTVAFTVTDVEIGENRYRHRIWTGPADGSEPARPFSAGPDDQLARWSPDGRLLALAVNRTDGPCQVCVLPATGGGERVVVAEVATKLTELEWSPDSRLLAFVAREPDIERYGTLGERRSERDMSPRRVTRLYSRLNGHGFVFDRPNHVMVVPADGSRAPLTLTPGPFQSSGISFSPDGSRVAFSSARHDTWDLDGAVDLWTVAADGSGEPERLTETGAEYSSPSFSPDGGRIAYLVDPTPYDSPRHLRLGVLEIESGRHVDLTGDLDRNCGPYGSARPPLWVGARVLSAVEDAGDVHVYSFPADGSGKFEPVVEGERWIGGWDAAAGVLAMVATSPTRLPELVARPLEASGEERLLTDLTGPFASRVALSAPVAFTARSADGTEVPCWAMPPVAVEAGERVPALLNVHGGPFTQYGNRFFDEFQLQAAAGFGVVYCNPRGSSGYSEAWGRAVRWPGCETDPGSGWGGVDYEDVMACIEEACRRFDWIDPDRLGILGGSYGGYMTSWVIGHSDRFKAACSERACNNLLTLEFNSDIATSFKGYVGASHLENPEAYLSRSPISFVGEMTTPVLILHSEEDLRCPIIQAEELFVALRLLGREPVFVRFPAESHELSRAGSPRHRVQRAELILEWFGEHLAAG